MSDLLSMKDLLLKLQVASPLSGKFKSRAGTTRGGWSAQSGASLWRVFRGKSSCRINHGGHQDGLEAYSTENTETEVPP
jgi:hypothetical protein